jgi:hypothetical protein
VHGSRHAAGSAVDYRPGEGGMNPRPGRFVHEAFRSGIRLRPKTWGKKSRDPRAARREGKREVAREV